MRKRNISLLILAAIVTFLMAGCKKDTTTLKARISPFSNESKVYIYGTSTPRWETGDLVNVNGTPCIVSVSTTSTIEAPTSNAYQAVYPNDLVANNGNRLGSSTVTLNIPRVQAYETTTNGQVVKAPMGAFVNGSSNLQFTNMGALLAIAVKNDKSDRDNLVIDSIAVQTVGNSPVLLWGTATVNDITSAQRAYEISSTGLTAEQIADHRIISLAKLNEQGNLATLAYNNEPKTFYLYVPSVSGSIDNRYKITIYSHIGRTKYIYERTQSNAGSGNIGLSQYAAVPYMTDDADETQMADTWLPGSIHSIFTIYNSNNPSQKRYIYFSQGNLQRISGAYQFAPQQESFLTTTSYGASTYIDQFSMSDAPTSGNWDIVNTTDYINRHSNIVGEWRTLTPDDWQRLLGINGVTGRRSLNNGYGEGHCYSIVRIRKNNNDIIGMLIYPDGYGGPFIAAHAAYNSVEEYPAIDEIPEGCIFLPAAGYSNPSQRQYPGKVGTYWSSRVGTGRFITVTFGVGTAFGIPNATTNAYPLYSIRLVHDTILAQ